MLDRLPPEICAYIFDVACRDTGYTGRSLSLVSRYIHETSALSRYTSIVLVGRAQILAFARLLDRSPTHLRTRYLFINGHESEAEMDQVVKAHLRTREARLNYKKLFVEKMLGHLPPGDKKLKEAKDALERETEKEDLYLDTFGREAASAVESILRSLAPTLEILDISLNQLVTRKMLHTTCLPHLRDLTTRCGFPIRSRDGIPLLEPTQHSLRYLHIVGTSHGVEQFFQNGLSHFAPSLTHLRLSQVGHDKLLLAPLESALGLGTSSASSTIELVSIKPGIAPSPQGCHCCNGTMRYRDLLKSARRLRDRDPRVLLLQADSTVPTEDPYFLEWMDKVNGGASYWDTGSMDTAVEDLGSE
ncbi:hypothetical protein K438DRAFT_1220371 [Mycena galopus ATCC 62051]|nr:hypothetical protein K438DRAFT_1220371 [Mycena galopus ATCC 62051]